MSKHLIFFIHGMGQHKDGWSDAAWKTLKDAFISYSELNKYVFEDNFERVEIIYDEEFELYRKRWKDDSSKLIDLITTGGASNHLVEQIANLGASFGKDTFFTTHLMDVVMYRFLSLVRTPVRISVAKQITKALINSAQTGTVNWSVVAHSLGTSVGHDTLHYMFQGGESSIDALSRQQFAPQTGLFVANVSRVLQSTVKAYASLVRPSWQRTTGIFEYFLNTHHALDPIPKPKPFDPGFDWIDEATRAKDFSRYQDIRISEITKPNIHDLDHYLANPLVHIPFFRTLFGLKNIIPAKTEMQAVEKHRLHAQSLKYDALRDQLIGLIDHQGPDIEGLLKAADTFNSITN